MHPTSSPARNVQRRSGASLGFTLIELLVVVAIIGVLISLLMPAVHVARESARRSQCTNNLRQLCLAIHLHHEHHAVFPPGSNLPAKSAIQLGLSWRVHILPFLEQSAIFDEINPGFGPAGENQEPGNFPIPTFTCPSASQTSHPGRSNYFGVMGAGRDNRIKHTEDHKICGNYFIDGMFFPDSRTTRAHIRDGMSNTVAIGERVYWVRDNWTDGSTWYGSPERKTCVYAAKNIRWPINANLKQVGYYVTDRSAPRENRKMLLNDLTFGSEHPVGATFAFADGSVHFLNASMEFTIFQDLATVNGREVNRWLP